MFLLVTVKKNVSKISPFRKPIDGLKKSWVAFQRKHGTRAVCIEATKAVLWEWCKIIKVFIPAEALKSCLSFAGLELRPATSLYHNASSLSWGVTMTTGEQKKPAGWVVRMTGGAMTGWFIKIIFILETFVVLSSHLYDEFFTVRSVRRLKWLLITTEARFFNESLQLKNNLFTVATDRVTIARTKLNTFQKDTPTFIVKMCRNIQTRGSVWVGSFIFNYSRYCSVPRWRRGRSFARSRSGWGCRGPGRDAAGAQRWAGTVCRASSGVRWMFTFWNRNTASSDAFGENKTGT